MGRRDRIGQTASLLLLSRWFVSKAVLHLMASEDTFMTRNVFIYYLFPLEEFQGFSKSQVNDGRSCDGEEKAPLQLVHYFCHPVFQTF